ncbi:5767_t:CDS:2 [Diversispora eburnea]|uniref:5767_t:CDS:1 n=1 Tax=Diversispora eburnea TaxID=1213867 RepID=A0A9N8ZIR7_9GLOM|nr:5767_t:CDS:2 [Diversispora eburnea]
MDAHKRNTENYQSSLTLVHLKNEIFERFILRILITTYWSQCACRDLRNQIIWKQ